MNTWSGKVLATMAMAALVCLLGMGRSGAWDQADLDKLLQTNARVDCNLSGADLSRAILLQASLHQTNLSGAT